MNWKGLESGKLWGEKKKNWSLANSGKKKRKDKKKREKKKEYIHTHSYTQVVVHISMYDGEEA